MSSYRTIIAACGNRGTVDQVGQTGRLRERQEYYLIVFEWEKVAGGYELSIMPE